MQVSNPHHSKNKKKKSCFLLFKYKFPYFNLCQLTPLLSLSTTVKSLPRHFTISHQAWRHKVPLSLSNSRLTNPSSQPLPVCQTLHSLSHLPGLLLDLSNTSMSLSNWRAQNWTRCSSCSLTSVFPQFIYMSLYARTMSLRMFYPGVFTDVHPKLALFCII